MRIFINISGIIFLILIGTIGYILIEKINFIDALYQTVITITTVGFREVKPLTNVGKIFTIFYLIFGLGFVSYTILNIGQKFFETTLFDFLTRSRRSLRKMEGHFIICGFGRLGQFVSKELEREKKEFIVIEKSPECIEILREKGYAFIEGDAREEEILLKAGIKRAKGIATLLGNDADNPYIVFTARELNPRILIVSKAEDELSYKKLIKAGANKVILPYEEGGIKIAQTLLRPNLLEFVDFIVQRQHLTLRVEEIEIKEDHEFSGKKLRDSGLREKYGMIAIAIRKGDNMIFNPGPEEILNPGDIIILMGEIKNFEKIKF